MERDINNDKIFIEKTKTSTIVDEYKSLIENRIKGDLNENK